MGGLKGKEVDEVINLMQLCPASSQAEGDKARFFAETQKLFGADEIVFLCPNSRTTGIDLKHSFSLQRDRAFLSRYADYFWQYDPLYEAQLGADQSVPAFRTEDVLPYDQYVKLKYYDDFLQPQDLFTELVIRLRFKSYFFGAISLLRSRGRPFFDKEDVHKAELLIPYIVNTIDVGDVVSRDINEQKLFERWLESQSEGIILLDADLRTLFYNSRADLFCQLLTGRKGLPEPDSSRGDIPIPDVIVQDCRCLARTSFDRKGVPGYDNRIVNSHNRRRYHIQYFMFNSPGSDEGRPSFIIVVNDLNRYSLEIDEIIAGQAKLSNREAAVARYAGLGWTNKEIADSIHSSPFTVQNQLKKVFEKTGLKNHTQLANLMKYSDSLPAAQ